MKITPQHSPRIHGSPYRAQKFLLIGNAELVKGDQIIKRTIRRKAKMAITFFAVCLVVAAWSKAASTTLVRSNLSESNRDITHVASRFQATNVY